MKEITKMAYREKITTKDIDGVSYIEIISASTKLGRFLAPSHYIKLDTIFGHVVTMRRLMEFLTKDKYPFDLLHKYRLDNLDIKRIRALRNRHTPHYWVIVLYYLILRTRNDEFLRQLLKMNTLPFAATTVEKSNLPVVNSTITTRVSSPKLIPYIGCVRVVENLVKEDKLDDTGYIVKMLDDEVGGDFSLVLEQIKDELDS